MKNTSKKIFGLIGIIACSLTFLVGCNNKNSSGPQDKNAAEEELITHIIEQSDPIATVTKGPFESIITGERETLPDDVKTYSSTAIFDMPKDAAINVVYNNEDNLSAQSVSSVLNNVVNANNDINIISIKDRGGNQKKNLLSTDGQKISISAPGGFEYGEVYQITLNNASYLNFEGRDPKVRKLTVEIEDDPSEAATYDNKVLKQGIINIDRTKILNKKQGKNGSTLSFDYDGKFPTMSKDTIFYATKDGNKDGRLDFYGAFISMNPLSDGKEHIIYRSPDIDEIYDSFRLKGKEEVDVSDAELLVDDSFAAQQFKQSSLARGLVKTLLNITPRDINNIIEILKHISVNISVNYIGNRVDSKFSASLNNFKVGENKYIGLEFAYESKTEYIMDFDLKISYSWIFPTGVDYKVKCIEDTQEAYFLRFNFDVRPMENIPSDTEYCDQIMDAMEKSMEGGTSILDPIRNPDDMGPSASGTKTTWPLLLVDIHYFEPLQIRFKIDFYIDAGFQIMGMGKYENHTTKVDFNFTNMDGDGQETDVKTEDSGNIVAYFGGNMHVEVGLRLSLGISLFGLYDYLHAEGYAEGYINISLSGMIAMNISFRDYTEFSGYISVDFALTIGVRAGLNLKAVVINSNFSHTWSWYLFRINYDNAMEHWGDNAATVVEMNKETLSLDETSALRIRYFDPLTWGVKERQYKASERFSVISGLLVRDNLEELTSGHIFEFSSNDARMTINEDGLIHVKDATEASFTAKIKIHVNKWAGYISDREITINYQASDVKDVFIDDELIDQQRPGYTIVLPEAKQIYGKGFDYYLSDEGVKYYPKDRYTLPNRSSSFTGVYHDLPTFPVYFYDSHMRLVAIDEVYEGYTAHAPNQEMRDRYMDEGWVFMSWDKPLTNITKETHIYGIYMFVN